MDRLLWIDMEMTGLDVEKEVVIEVAAIVTDIEFRELETYHAIVRQPPEYLERMDGWNKQHHGASGLTALVPNGLDPTHVENDLIALTARHWAENAVIAGNSIGQDRLFIDKYFKRFAARLHYRMLDVTAWKVLMNARYGIKHDKKNSHRAVDDIRESIAEMKLYLTHVSKKPVSPA